MSTSQGVLLMCSLGGQVKAVELDSLSLRRKFYSQRHAQICDLYLDECRNK